MLNAHSVQPKGMRLQQAPPHCSLHRVFSHMEKMPLFLEMHSPFLLAPGHEVG